MGYAIDRTTKQVLVSVHTPDYDTANYLVAAKQDPNVAVIAGLLETGVPSRYLVVESSAVREMDAGEKAAQDAADLPAYKNSRSAALLGITEAFVLTLYPEVVQSQLSSLYDDAIAQGLRNRATYISQFIRWRGAIYSYQTATQDAIALAIDAEEVDNLVRGYEPQDFAASDPRVTVAGALAIMD